MIGGRGAEMPHVPIVARVDALIRHGCAWHSHFIFYAGFSRVRAFHDLVRSRDPCWKGAVYPIRASARVVVNPQSSSPTTVHRRPASHSTLYAPRSVVIPLLPDPPGEAGWIPVLLPGSAIIGGTWVPISFHSYALRCPRFPFSLRNLPCDRSLSSVLVRSGEL